MKGIAIALAAGIGAALATLVSAPGAALAQQGPPPQAADNNCAMMVGWNTAAGANAGGAAGSTAGGATGGGPGSFFGGLFGGVIGGVIANVLSRADCDQAHDAFQHSLDNPHQGQTTTWSNSQTGHSGTFTPVSTHKDKQGRVCRTYKTEVNTGKGGQSQSSEPAKPTQTAQSSGGWVQPGQQQPAKPQAQPQEHPKATTQTACRNANGEWEVVSK